MGAIGGSLDGFKRQAPAGGAEGEGKADPPGQPPKKDKVKPMSKRLSGSISSCSSKLNEIMVWKSKLEENKVGLTLNFI